MENKKLNIYLLYAMALLQGMVFYGPIATLYRRATMLSVYSGIMNIAAIITNMMLGKMADINIRYAMASGALFCGLGLALYAAWESMEIVQ